MQREYLPVIKDTGGLSALYTPQAGALVRRRDTSVIGGERGGGGLTVLPILLLHDSRYRLIGVAVAGLQRYALTGCLCIVAPAVGTGEQRILDIEAVVIGTGIKGEPGRAVAAVPAVFTQGIHAVVTGGRRIIRVTGHRLFGGESQLDALLFGGAKKVVGELLGEAGLTLYAAAYSGQKGDLGAGCLRAGDRDTARGDERGRIAAVDRAAHRHLLALGPGEVVEAVEGTDLQMAVDRISAGAILEIIAHRGLYPDQCAGGHLAAEHLSRRRCSDLHF